MIINFTKMEFGRMKERGFSILYSTADSQHRGGGRLLDERGLASGFGGCPGFVASALEDSEERIVSLRKDPRPYHRFNALRMNRSDHLVPLRSWRLSTVQTFHVLHVSIRVKNPRRFWRIRYQRSNRSRLNFSLSN